MAIKEPLNSRRIKVINTQTYELHDDVANLNESLVDKDKEESVALIDSIRTRLNLLKDQIVNGDII
jgi:hypothetical protein